MEIGAYSVSHGSVEQRNPSCVLCRTEYFAESRRILDDIPDGVTVPPGEDSETIDSYSLRLIRSLTITVTARKIHTPTKMESRPVSIALLALAGLLTAATSPDRRSILDFNCPC
ncbi:hypothetical protein PMIN03_012726 [Paraphaeosphaeria minitans]